MVDKAKHEANRLSWNVATQQHDSHRRELDVFFKQGGHTLFPEEMELLGDIRGKRLLHLQCNNGLDSLSIAAQLGADVTGVDISDVAIESAQMLSRASGIPATFHRDDVIDWFATNTDEYDVVFSSYGYAVWLSDLTTWGQGVARCLKPGGRFVTMEFHPFMSMFDWDVKLAYPYMSTEAIRWDDGVGDYVGVAGGDHTNTGEAVTTGGQPFVNPHPAYEYTWSLSQIITALLDAGLQLTVLREFTYSNGFTPFGDMRELPGRRMVMPEGSPDFPLMFGLVATKPL